MGECIPKRAQNLKYYKNFWKQNTNPKSCNADKTTLLNLFSIDPSSILKSVMSKINSSNNIISINKKSKFSAKVSTTRISVRISTNSQNKKSLLITFRGSQTAKQWMLSSLRMEAPMGRKNQEKVMVRIAYSQG